MQYRVQGTASSRLALISFSQVFSSAYRFAQVLLPLFQPLFEGFELLLVHGF
jgi:hypothetical protein